MAAHNSSSSKLPNPPPHTTINPNLTRPSLFTARPLNPLTPLNPSASRPNPNPNPHGILYPVPSAAAAASSRPPPPPPSVPSAGVTLASNPPPPPAGFVRVNHMTSHVHQHQQQHPFAFGGSDVHVAHHLRPPFVIHRSALGPTVSMAPLRGVPIASQSKVAPLPVAAPTLEYSISKERERIREDNILVVNDRKVRIMESDSCTLYSLCRSWVQNGVPNDNHPNFGSSERLLPRPLPASLVDSEILRKSESKDEDLDSTDQQNVGSVEQIPARQLLEGHIKRAKRIRARLQKERLIRIRRYKQRLSLLLPPPIELTRLENNTLTS